MDTAGRAHAFVADIEQPELSDADRRHLDRVLRVRPDEPITVADGAGRWRWCRLGAELEALGPVEHDDAPAPAITLAFALVKGDRPELIVQKLTEIGVDRIAPFVAERSVVKWDDAKTVRQHERLATVAREAAMQSRRSWLPVVEPVDTFAVVAARDGAVLAERGGGPPSLARPVILVGPEGGWSDRERASGLETVGLGSTVLRAETATIVAAAALGFLRAKLLEPVSRHGG